MAADLVALRAEMDRASEVYQGWAMQNTYGKSAAELVEIDLGYRKAQQAYSNAMSDYYAALDAEAAKEK